MSSQNLTQASSEPPVPPGFLNVEGVQTLFNTISSDEIKRGKFIHVIGFIKDYQPPMATHGQDYKCAFELIDRSIPTGESGIKFTIFWPKENMPNISGPSDVVLVRYAKIQMYGGNLSLIANKTSQFHVLKASNIPRDLFPVASSSLWSSASLSRSNSPTATELTYAVWASRHAGEMNLPTEDQFQAKTVQAMQVRDKFSLLKDVKANNYHNILGEVIKVYDPPSGPLIMYLSDYTSNSSFYNNEWPEGQNHNGQYGDEFGYSKKTNQVKAADTWPGPYGKMCIQLTIYDEHAEIVRETVNANQWVLLSNVRIKYSNEGKLLEGVLYSERDRFNGKIHVRVMELAEELDQNDIRWKEAVRRKCEWEKRFERQKKDLLNETAKLGDKQKRNSKEPETRNRKQRRKEIRAAAEKRATLIDAKLVKCKHPEQPVISIADVLHPQKLMPDEDYSAPFTVTKYRANVRIVDYFPHKLEDFAVGHRVSDFDMLSDYSGGDDTDPEEDHRLSRSGKGFSGHSWEWRFALQVEDSKGKDPKDRVWLLVDNHAAEGLLDLPHDATSLRENPRLLQELKEQLFKLWGDLEEQKSAKIQMKKNKAGLPLSPLETTSPSSTPGGFGDQPDVDDSENENEQQNDTALRQSLTTDEVAISNSSLLKDETIKPNNKLFTCCIKQYGVKVSESDPSKANAGNGKRWQRIFGLFDTYIR